MQLTRNQIQVFSLIAVSILSNVTLSGGRVAASLFMLRHGGSTVLAGFAYSAYSLVPALLSLFIGRWIDKVGPRKVMRTSQIAMIAGLAAPTLYPSVFTVFACALVCGFGFAAYILAANVAVSMMPFEHHGERVGMLGWLAMGGSAAGVLGPMVVGIAIDFGGFAMGYAAMAAIVLLSLLLSFVVDVPGDVGGKTRPKGGGSVVRLVFSDPRLLRIYLLAMVISMSYDGFAFMTPVLGEERGLSATTIGLIMSCSAIGTFVAGAVLPWLSRHFSEWRMLMLGYGTIALVFILLPAAHNGYLYASLGFVFGVAAGSAQPNILSLIYRAMPEGKAGEGAGLRSMMGNSVGLTAPSVYGSIAGVFGAVPVFIGVGCVAAVASWQSLLGLKSSKADAAKP